MVGDGRPLHAQVVPRLPVPQRHGGRQALAGPGASGTLPEPTGRGISEFGGADVARRAERARGLVRRAEALPRRRFRGVDARGATLLTSRVPGRPAARARPLTRPPHPRHDQLPAPRQPRHATCQPRHPTPHAGNDAQ